MSVADLRKINGIKGNNIAVGKKLKVGESTKYIAAVTPREKKEAASNNSKKAAKAVTYTVKKGDNLDGIAKKYDNVSVADLMKKNNLKSAKNLRPGMRLKVM